MAAGNAGRNFVLAEEAAEACSASGGEIYFGFRPPFVLYEALQLFVSGLGGQVLAQKTCRRPLPCALVREVPPGNCLDGRVREKDGIELGHFLGLILLTLRCTVPALVCLGA